MKNRPIADFVTDNCVVTYRGDIVENRHHVHAAVVDADGHMLYTVGNPSRLTLIRSAAKPAQALAVIEAGVFEKFDLDDADLALMCASHNSEDQHILRASTMLQKVRAEETDLRCGGHPALNDAVNKAWIKADYTPTGICNNCCGKHVGMIAGAKCLGAEVSDYHLPSNPMQKLVKRVMGEMADIEEDEAVKWAIDGCNLPAPAIPLSALARMYGSLATAADLEKLDTVPQRTQHLARIFRAMTTYPELVGGEGRFCTRIMAAYNGILVGKLGADGCYGIGIRSTESTRKAGLNDPIGIAVKIEDGSIPILYSAVMEILEQLEIGTSEIREMLADFHRPKLSNTAGVEIGHVDCAFKLRAVE